MFAAVDQIRTNRRNRWFFTILRRRWSGTARLAFVSELHDRIRQSRQRDRMSATPGSSECELRRSFFGARQLTQL